MFTASYLQSHLIEVTHGILHTQDPWIRCPMRNHWDPTMDCPHKIEIEHCLKSEYVKDPKPSRVQPHPHSHLSNSLQNLFCCNNGKSHRRKETRVPSLHSLYGCQFSFSASFFLNVPPSTPFEEVFKVDGTTSGSQSDLKSQRTWPGISPRRHSY